MLNYSLLPENLQDGMKRYIEDGVPTGDFLRFCLENRLVEAVGQASTRHWNYIFSVCDFLYNELPDPERPESPWGTKEAVKNHLERVQNLRRQERELSKPAND